MFRVGQLIVLVTAVQGGTVVGQQPQRPQDIAPPPMKTISRVERAQIDQTDGPKEHVKVTLALAETHLKNSEIYSSQSDFAGASAAIGRYWALIDDVFGFLKTMKPDTTKTRDLYKRVELTLRAHGPRLIAIRRSTPAEYSVWIKEIEELARNGRTEALNSFYGHTVLRESNQKASPQRDMGPPQKTSGSTEVKKP